MAVANQGGGRINNFGKFHNFDLPHIKLGSKKLKKRKKWSPEHPNRRRSQRRRRFSSIKKSQQNYAISNSKASPWTVDQQLIPWVSSDCQTRWYKICGRRRPEEAGGSLGRRAAFFLSLLSIYFSLFPVLVLSRTKSSSFIFWSVPNRLIYL